MGTTPPAMNAYLGKHIRHICPFSIGKDDSQNHCAHFVSHMMGYDFEETCRNFSFADKQREGKGASLRVERLFNRMPRKGAWAARPAIASSCLIFATLASNVHAIGDQFAMGNHPRKHVGIHVNGWVWNYSNTQREVVADTAAVFLRKFERAYRTPGQSVEFYYAEFA